MAEPRFDYERDWSLNITSVTGNFTLEEGKASDLFNPAPPESAALGAISDPNVNVFDLNVEFDEPLHLAGVSFRYGSLNKITVEVFRSTDGLNYVSVSDGNELPAKPLGGHHDFLWWPTSSAKYWRFRFDIPVDTSIVLGSLAEPLTPKDHAAFALYHPDLPLSILQRNVFLK